VRGLAGKVIVVAGGAGYIGTASSVRLAEEGAYVVVGDYSAKAAAAVVAQIEAAGGRAVATRVDVSDEGSVVELFGTAVDAFGGVDGVHLNAADTTVVLRDTNVGDVDLEVFDQTIAVNLRGHFLVTRHAIPLLLERGGGALAYTSSAASYIGEPERVSYGISKAGVNALVRHVASRWGKQGIRANAVAPGMIVHEKLAEYFGEEGLEAAKATLRSDRHGKVDDIAAMVAFLMSDDGSWVSGQVYGVDGGLYLR
jgi:NAD(P)-dependent dehydrogenase (short-subunit alcohol dehydrogenase family)